MLNSHLCQRGRGGDKIKCAFFDVCGVQRQKATRADIWIGAHELIAHELPKAFGDVGRVFVDEDPTDAFLFGTSDTPGDMVAFEVRELKKTPRHMKVGMNRDRLMDGRRALFDVLAPIVPPENEYLGAPVTREVLGDLLSEYLEPVVDDKDEPAPVPADWAAAWAR